MQKVRISISHDTAYIRFRYNPDVVEIMQRFRCHWDPKTQLWLTSPTIAKSIYHELKEQLYDVRMTNVI